MITQCYFYQGAEPTPLLSLPSQTPLTKVMSDTDMILYVFHYLTSFMYHPSLSESLCCLQIFSKWIFVDLWFHLLLVTPSTNDWVIHTSRFPRKSSYLTYICSMQDISVARSIQLYYYTLTAILVSTIVHRPSFVSLLINLQKWDIARLLERQLK